VIPLISPLTFFVGQTPVQRWPTADISSAELDKGKHILIEIGGSTTASLHFSAGSKETAEEIHAKLLSSKALSAPAAAAAPVPVASPPPKADSPPAQVVKKATSVHFGKEPEYIPPREASVDDYEPEPESAGAGAQEDGAAADALYDFVADGDDELSVSAGDRLVVLDKEGDDWWKVRNVHGAEGVVPASYVQVRDLESWIITKMLIIPAMLAPR
jgi:hypothetical protein